MTPEIIQPLVNLYYERHLNRQPSCISSSPEYLMQLPELINLYSQAGYWHGTGRYQYNDKHTEIVDRFSNILQCGGLVPHRDDWDQGVGVTESISLALPRMYGRLYASIHTPNGGTTNNELGARTLWGYYFFGVSWFQGLLEYPPSLQLLLTFDYWKIGESVIPNYPEKILSWGSKIMKNPETFYKVFTQGTDIETNYPILIGIKSSGLKCEPSSKFVRVYERRISSPIGYPNMTHLEVPMKHLEETRQLMKTHGWNNIPLLPLEWGDEYCREFHFTELVSPKPLIRK